MNAPRICGSELIQEERKRQIEKEGFDYSHDDAHTDGSLVDAALCYATVAGAQSRGASLDEWPVEMFDGFHDSLLQWPWHETEYKPTANIVVNLVKAGALIAAEIDRLNRSEAK